MSTDGPRLAVKVRELRRREGVTQARMAARLGVSASYLNLIENGRRPLTAQLLLKLAQEFQVDLREFAADDSEALAQDLAEAFGDPMFDAFELKAADVRELAAASPSVGRAITSMYDALRASRQTVAQLRGVIERARAGGAGVDDEVIGAPDTSPSEEVSAMLQRHLNYFPEVEEAAETLWKVWRLEPQSLYRGLTRHLMEAHRVLVKLVPAHVLGRAVVRRFDRARSVLMLSEVLPPRSRNFQLAHQIALLSYGDVIDRIVKDAQLVHDGARGLARVVLANYFAGAVLQPYQPFLEAAEEVRYDIEMLGHKFATSFEQVCHRLTTLRRPGAEGVAFHMVRVDIAGNISKRFSGSGIRFARYSGACPRWNVYNAFLTPAMMRVQISEMPEGQRYFCVSRTVVRHSGGYLQPSSLHAIGLGCRMEEAGRLVYSEGVDLGSRPVPIGVTCTLCPRTDCEQRAFPASTSPLLVDEDVRGASVYAVER
jgi:predicted transcriptional regulator/transcriptional regulator with XRE-family HTH domain